MQIQSKRNNLWFGTTEYADWMATPLSGADSSPASWGFDGTLLNGGGFGFHAFDSHKRYVYEWPESSSRETAQKMKSFRDGTYGRGLIYFQDPLTYDTNVLPARWADPSMALGDEAPSLVPGVIPTSVATSNPGAWGLPVRSAQYDLDGVPAFNPVNPLGRVFIPIPADHRLYLGAFYSATGRGGVYATPLNLNGTLGTSVRITPSANTVDDVFQDYFEGIRGVYLRVGKDDSNNSTITLSALIGRLVHTGDTSSGGVMLRIRRKPWIGGQGNSGVRFAGTPSYVSNSGVEGGRIGFAASFIEVGDWAYG